jgi:hypothetical protein
VTALCSVLSRACEKDTDGGVRSGVVVHPVVRRSPATARVLRDTGCERQRRSAALPQLWSQISERATWADLDAFVMPNQAPRLSCGVLVGAIDFDAVKYVSRER